MFSTSILFMSGLFFSTFPLALWPIIGFAVSLRVSRAFCLGIGMIMFFQAWLQFINFDGSWPPDQPADDEYIASKQEISRLDRLVSTGPWPSRAEWDDYRRCMKLNVCVRLFARQ